MNTATYSKAKVKKLFLRKKQMDVARPQVPEAASSILQWTAEKLRT